MNTKIIAKKILIVVTILLVVYWAIRWTGYISYIIDFGFTDKGNPDGSPAALVINFIFESFLLIYLSSVLYFLIKSGRKNIH